MQVLAAWLVARPLNAVLALAVTISQTYLSFLSGVVLILLILSKGVRTALIKALFAGSMVAVIGLVVGVPLVTVLASVLAIWLPATLLGVLLTTTRSLTLTLQLSVIMALLAMVGFFIVTDDPVAFWRDFLEGIIAGWRELGLTEQADLVASNIDAAAKQMTMFVAFTSWTVHVVTCVLGYLFYRQLPGETADYGRFRDLNIGRVIALLMALTALISLFGGAIWLQNIAFVMFLAFWLQGLAIVHWLRGEGHLPVIGVVAVYVLIPFANVIWVIGLAVLGYIDTWFGLRRAKTT